MQYNRLGNTGLNVSRICLGTMTLGGNEDAGMWKAIGDLGRQDATALISRALEKGVNFIDTADVYSFGESERLVGHALRDIGVARKDVVVATKVGGQMGPERNDVGASRGHIMDSVRASLDRLQLDHVDLYQIHIDDLTTPIEETLRALDDIVSQGLVRYVGVSNWRAGKIAKAQAESRRTGFVRFDTLQAYYSIAGRDIEREIVPVLEEEKMGLMVWSPLAGGLLSGKYDLKGETGRRTGFDFPPVDRQRVPAILEALAAIANDHGVSVAQVSLAWLLAKPFVTSVVVGAKRLDQLDDNLAAADVRLSQTELEKLDAVSGLVSEYPGWMYDFVAAPVAN